MFSLYTDEDRLERALHAAIRSVGFELLSATEAGMGGRRDEDHLAFAAANGRVLYSANVRDYNRINSEWLAAGRSHAGIILCADFHMSVGEQARRLFAIGQAITAQRMENNLEFLSNYRPAAL